VLGLQCGSVSVAFFQIYFLLFIIKKNFSKSLRKLSRRGEVYLVVLLVVHLVIVTRQEVPVYLS